MHGREATRTVLSGAELDVLREELGRIESLRRGAVPGAVGLPVQLTGGMYAAVYRFPVSEGPDLVAKVAPRTADRLLRYEHGIIRTEALVMRLGAEAGLPTPPLVHADFTHKVIDADVLVSQFLPGTAWTVLAGSPDIAADLPELSLTPARVEVGAFMAALHRITAPVAGNAQALFGYPAAEAGLRAATWPAAFRAMTDAVLHDALRWQVPLDLPRLERAFARCAWALDEVRVPTLVHLDLWPGNLLLDPATLRLTGVVDGERAVWGDPLLDFVGAQPLFTGPVHPDLIDGYLSALGTLPLALEAPGRHAGGQELPVGGVTLHTPALRAAANVRLSAYRLYMAVIMRVEVEPRSLTPERDTEYLAHIDQVIAQLLKQLGA